MHNKYLNYLLLFISLIPAIGVVADTKDPQYLSEIVKLDEAMPEEHLQNLLDMGGIMLNRRENLALMLLPATDESNEGIGVSAKKRIPRRDYPSKPRLNPQPTMDVALMVSGVNRIFEEQSLPQVFDGTGVVVGFCDIGFDTHHLNFIDSNGECRIRKVVKYTESEGIREEYTTPDEIYQLHTDNPNQFHATHVAGIMAGSHEVSGPQVATGSKLRGVASGADIVATLSELTDVGLLAGVEDIIKYAKETGKPAVINLSMGSYTGPHDGSSLFCQYLDLCAEDAIICLSSGNEGAHTNHQYLTNSSSSKPLRVRIAGNDWVNLTLYGQTDIYASDDTPFTLALRISDSTLDEEQPFIYEINPIDFSASPLTVISSNERQGIEEWKYDRNFARYFDGEVYINGGIDPENGRYYASVLYNCTTEELYSKDKPWARYRLELIARPSEPIRLDAFADGSHSWLANWYGNPLPPGNTISISDLATGYKTISVGMYCTGQKVMRASGAIFEGEFDTPLQITNHSSYGILADGRRMPMTVAPGMPIVSSISGAYIETAGDGDSSLRISDDYGNLHYWGPMSGTSMSCPFVAGTIATWLQADPTLTWRDVQNIITSNNFYPYFSPDGTDPRYGMGLFDGYGGLLEVIKNSQGSVEEISGDLLSMRIAHGTLEIFNPVQYQTNLQVYTLLGQKINYIDTGNEAIIYIPINDIKEKSGGSPVVVRLETQKTAPKSMVIM